jgi:phosphomannomutase
MAELARRGAQRVVGYEANGGFLHASTLHVPGGDELAPLPTRDPVIVHLAVLLLARNLGRPVSELLSTLPRRVTASGRDQSFETTRSQALLQKLREAPAETRAEWFGLGPLTSLDQTDGLRMTFDSGEILHFRPSGNAPELRCYAEAETQGRAAALVVLGLERARALA